jgi:ribosome-binding protein aMBF1 (putative translation factor)
MREMVEEYLRRYGEHLREQRQRCGLTQIKVAQSLHISQAVVSHIETGQMLPPKIIEDAMIKLYRARDFA